MSEIETNKTIMCDETNHMEFTKMMQDAIRKATLKSKLISESF